MPRQIRVQFPGALYYVMSRGNRDQNIFVDDVDRQDFIKTLAEACQKTSWRVHAYGLMRNYFDLVLETPEANLVSGMSWLLSTYTIRLNGRHKLSGHVFAGRYKALPVELTPRNLKSICDFVHLSPAQTGLIEEDDSLFAYPWNSLGSYAAARKFRPSWVHVEKLLAAHGINEDSAAGRAKFQRKMETLRDKEPDVETVSAMRRGWYFGTETFKQLLLKKMEGELGAHHSGEIRQQAALAKADQIVTQQLKKLRWQEEDLKTRRKSDPKKLALAAILRRETTLTVKQIAARLNLGSAKSANALLHRWMQNNPETPPATSQPPKKSPQSRQR